METSHQTSQFDLETLRATLLSTLDEGIFFKELAQYLERIIPADEIKVFKAFEDGSNDLIVSNGNILSEPRRFQVNENLAANVIKNKRPYYSNNIKRDPMFSMFEYEIDAFAELSIPVTCRGIVLATISFISSKQEILFNDDHVARIKELLTEMETPLINMTMYLSAKNLNELLMKKIKVKEEELSSKLSNDINLDVKKVQEKEILGKSKIMQDTFGLVDKVALTDSNVLIQGETGVGKELISRRIHSRGGRNNNSYVIANCGALSEALLESELFGHVKGAFSGAMSDKIGLLEMAHNGTLVLVEVAELTPSLQIKLNRYLQSREAYKVGATTPFHSNARIISCTNKDLLKEVEKGHFSEDLYFRINSITVNVPSLKDREEDVILLANHFLSYGKTAQDQKSFAPGAMKILKDYDWPGNVRELKSVIERAYIMSEGSIVESSHLPENLRTKRAQEPAPQVYRPMTLCNLEKEHICMTLDHLNGNKTRSAKVLGITVKTLYNKLHSYGMIQSRDNA